MKMGENLRGIGKNSGNFAIDSKQPCISIAKFNQYRLHIPALITSTPVGYHRSPCLKSNSTVLFASVRKYSPSSTCVPSHSNTTQTGSEAGTPSLSFPIYQTKEYVYTNLFCYRTFIIQTSH